MTEDNWSKLWFIQMIMQHYKSYLSSILNTCQVVINEKQDVKSI